MNQSKIRLFREFIITQFNFLTFYPVVMTFTVLAQAVFPPERPKMWVWLLGGLVGFGLFLVRSKIDNVVLMILGHIAAMAVQVGLSQIVSTNDNPVNMILYLAFSFGFAGYSLMLRFKTESYEDSPVGILFAVGVAALMILIQRYVSDYEWTRYYVYVIIVLIGIFFLNSYITEYLKFLLVNANSTGIMPEKEIFRSGMRLAALYTFVSVAILLATSQLSWLGKIVEGVRRIIVAIVQFISELLPEKKEKIPSVNGKIEPLPVMEESTGAMPISEGFWLWDVLVVVLLVVCVALFLFALYKAIRRMLKIINEALQNQRKTTDNEALNEIVDVREKLDISKSKGRKNKTGEKFGLFDTRERIRRIYKKNVAMYKPNRLTGSEKQRKDDFTEERLKFYTAREMEDRMELSFADIYEKARYSREECTAQDLKDMKDAFK